jgi:HEPN domain-containing protein
MKHFQGTSMADFQALANMRVREARALFSANEFDGAYYLAGYSVECALKAVLCKAIPEGVLLAKQDIERFYTHDLGKLLEFAELGEELKRDRARATSWLTVRSWNEQRRYARGIDQLIAAELLQSIEDPRHGILVWLKQYW